MSLRLLTCLTGLLLASPLAAQTAFEQEVRPFVAKHCARCHNAKTKRGKLDLERFKTADDAKKEAAVWEGAADRVRAHEMPPEGARQPSIEKRAAFLAWAKTIERKDKDCKRLATDQTQNFYRGHVMSRRLNRAEYDNTVRDLFGLDFRLGERLPADGAGGEGFDNTGDALFTSPIHLEKYLAVAETILRHVLDTGDKPEVKRHFTAAQREEARKRLLIAAPGKGLNGREAARKIVAAFAQKAYRRPVEAAEVERLLTVFDRAQKRGDSFEASLKLPLKAVLISPNFLFLVEPEPAKDGVYKLGDYPLAARLSYFVWASMPDEELFRLAADGSLTQPDVLSSQVRRMLRDPKARDFAQNFVGQWLGLKALGETVKPDPQRFPEFDAELADAMRQEPARLFEAILREDRSLLELLDADYTFVSEKLAAIYGLQGVSGSEFRRVSLTDRSRGG